MTLLDRLVFFLTILIAALWINSGIHEDRRSELRNKVASEVVYVYGHIDSEYSVFGTGFHVIAPSGRPYIVTNRHVCENSTDGTVVIDTGTYKIRKKILYEDSLHDLCLIQNVYPNGLYLAHGVAQGQIVSAIGHPKGFDITMTSGEVVGYDPISINTRIQNVDQENKCKKWKNNTVNMVNDDSGQTVEVCTTTEAGLITTATIHPGSSGSPVVDNDGNVIGVMFCTDSDDNWGRAVPLQYLKAFLKGR